jgi:hypothetical protein
MPGPIPLALRAADADRAGAFCTRFFGRQSMRWRNAAYPASGIGAKAPGSGKAA